MFISNKFVIKTNLDQRMLFKVQNIFAKNTKKITKQLQDQKFDIRSNVFR